MFWNEGSYFGPAAIVNAHRFIFDSRDEAAAERLDILNEVDGGAAHHVQLHRVLPARHPGDQAIGRRALMFAADSLRAMADAVPVLVKSGTLRLLAAGGRHTSAGCSSRGTNKNRTLLPKKASLTARLDVPLRTPW